MEDISAINVLLTIVLAHTPTENTIQPQTSESSSFNIYLAAIYQYTSVKPKIAWKSWYSGGTQLHRVRGARFTHVQGPYQKHLMISIDEVKT